MPKRIGQVVPSANTIVEDVSERIRKPYIDNIAFHYARFPVRQFEPNDGNKAQFGTENIMGAIDLLADIKPDAIVWNGSSGGLLGLDSDNTLSTLVASRYGIPFTTTMLATCEAMNRFDIGKYALLTPYVESLTKTYANSLAEGGYVCQASDGFGIDDIVQMSHIRPSEILKRARKLIRPDTQALLLICTNFAGAYAAEELEGEYDIPVIDSTVASVWKALRLAGEDITPQGWGRIMNMV